MRQNFNPVTCALYFSLLTFQFQAQTPKAFENAAGIAFEAKDYHAAMRYYEKVVEMEPNRPDILYRTAESARLYGAFPSAEKYYEQTLAADFDSRFSKATVGLATVKKTLGKYDEAMRLFKQFSGKPNADAQLRRLAQQEEEVCEWAMEKITNPAPGVAIEKMPDAFNTNESDFGITVRGDTLFFSSFRADDWGDKHIPPRPILRVMQSVKEGEPAPAAFNAADRHTAHAAFSPDGSILVFNHCDYTGTTDISCQLYFSRRTPDGWSEPTPLPANINVENYTATEPSISARSDGYYDLWYASDCPGGKGGKDIWRVQFSLAGNFGQPENLAALNTPEDEITPFFDNRTQTLYFSSTGYLTLGGFDIYKAVLQKEGWQTPENLGTPFNSSYNELYYATAGEELAYMTSNRPGSEPLDEYACCYDLYKVKFLPLQLEALAFSESTKAPLEGVVFTLAEAPQKDAPLTHFAETGNQADFSVKRDKRYIVIAMKEAYLPDTVYVETAVLPIDLKFREKLYLPPDISLAVRVFNQLDNKPLYGATVRLFEESGRVRGEKNTGARSNESALPVDYKRHYIVAAFKEKFVPDTVLISDAELRSIEPGARLIKDLYLMPATLDSLLPLAIFFDNDQPEPNMRADKTILSYDETYRLYMSRRELFIQEVTKNMDEAEKAGATERLNKFFDDNVKNGFVRLEYFAENLDVFLDYGFRVEILVKGFASPLASPEYNLALTRRRIVSVLNYLRKFGNGIYGGFIQQRRLLVSTAPLGESAAPPGISDNARERLKSVFSVEASSERRAEILEVRLSRVRKEGAEPGL